MLDILLSLGFFIAPRGAWLFFLTHGSKAVAVEAYGGSCRGFAVDSSLCSGPYPAVDVRGALPLTGWHFVG